MAKQQQVDWHEGGGFAKMREFRRLLREYPGEDPSLYLHQFGIVIVDILEWCYGSEWVEKYGDEAIKQIKQGILDK